MKLNKSLFKKDFADLCKNIDTLYTMLGIPIVIIFLFFFFLQKKDKIFLFLNHSITLSETNHILEKFNLLNYADSTAFFLLQWNTIYFYIIALIVFILPMVLASTSFTSEKEHGTIEILFHAPISDSDLLFTKMFVSTMLSLFLGLLCYGLIVISSYFHSGPQALLYMVQFKWLLLHFILIPIYSILSAGIGLCISIVKKSSRAALMISFIFVLPFILAITPLILGTIVFSVKLAFLYILIGFISLWIVFCIALRLFNREKILLSYY